MVVEREHVHHVFLELGDPLGDVAVVLEAIRLVRRAHVEELGEDQLANLLWVADAELVVNGDLADDGLEALLAEGLGELVFRSVHDVVQAVDAVHLVLVVDGVGDLVELFLRRHDLRLCLLVLEGDIAGANVVQAVEKEVDALRVIAVQECEHRLRRNANTGALVVDVKSVDDRAQIVVDLDVVVPADVLGGVEHVRLVGDLVEEAFDGCGVVAHAGKVAHEVPIEAFRFTLEVAEVEVARAPEQLHLVGVVGLDDLEARGLRASIALSTQRKAGAARAVEVLAELAHVVEHTRQRARQTVGVGLLHVAEPLVVEGADVVDVGPLNHLEMDLGVLEHELVGVILVQLAGERAVGEDGVHVVDLEEALVEELADGALADPVVVVGVDGTVRRETPVVPVEVGTDKGAREVLGGEDRAVD